MAACCARACWNWPAYAAGYVAGGRESTGQWGKHEHADTGLRKRGQGEEDAHIKIYIDVHTLRSG